MQNERMDTRNRSPILAALHSSFFPAISSVVICGCAAPAAEEGSSASPPALVADADGAMAALTASPRHGEWIDVPCGGGPPVRSWIVYPERSGAAPVVIVIHEIFGLTDWIRAVADSLAAEGFIAIAPDLLSGKGPDGGGTDSFAGDAARTAIRSLEPEEVTARLDAVRGHSLALPSAAKSSGCIGFCWGGATTFRYATAQPSLGAAAVYYGTGPTDESAIARIACPVLGLYGGDDARVTSTVEATTAAMRKHGKSYDPRTYPGAGHGFLRQQSGRAENAEAAREAWTATIGFLRTHLE
jgi:carboxymethylenebutenolidase